MDIKIEDLGLCSKTYNIFKRVGLNTVNQITALTEKELLKIRNCGKSQIEEVYEKINNLQTIEKLGKLKDDVISLQRLELENKTIAALKRANVNNIIDLIAKTKLEVKKIRNIKEKVYYDIISKVESLGFKFKEGEII